MAEFNAYIIQVSKSLSCKDTAYLDRLHTYRAANPRIVYPNAVLPAPTTQQGQLSKLNQNISAYITSNYYADLYNRVVISPSLTNLGAISTAQTFDVHLWNANHHKVELSSISIAGGDGITLSGASAPLTLQPLALGKWTVKIDMDGASEIDYTITFHLVGEANVQLQIKGSRSQDWSFNPDWSSDVVEKLEFLTVVHQSLTGAEQRIAKRLTPRRTFEFKLTAVGAERQRLENNFYANGTRVWMMPIFPHKTNLTKAAVAGVRKIYLNTIGLDFSAGGRAMLEEEGLKEMVELTSVSADAVEIKNAINNPFTVNASIYPLRSAVLTDMPQMNRLSDSVATAQVRMQIHEANDYVADISHLPTYRGQPVLEPSSEWSEDVTAQYTRLLKTLDNGSSLPHYLDTAQKAFQVTSHRFLLDSAESQHRLRSMFYYLRGRQRAIWVATSTSDLILSDDVLGNSIKVQFVDYTACLLKQAGRQDVRIECVNGEIYYRRIQFATVVDSQTEQLTLDGEPLNLKREQVAKISFLTLSRLDSDSIEWVHHTNTVASVMVSFRGLRDELEI